MEKMSTPQKNEAKSSWLTPWWKDLVWQNFHYCWGGGFKKAFFFPFHISVNLSHINILVCDYFSVQSLKVEKAELIK